MLLFSFAQILYSNSTVVCFSHVTLFLRFIHIVVGSYDSFIFICMIFHQVRNPQVIYPFTYQWTLGCFQFFAITNNAAMNILVHVSAFVFSKISEKFSKMVLLVYTPSELGTVPSV